METKFGARKQLFTPLFSPHSHSLGFYKLWPSCVLGNNASENDFISEKIQTRLLKYCGDLPAPKRSPALNMNRTHSRPPCTATNTCETKTVFLFFLPIDIFPSKIRGRQCAVLFCAFLNCAKVQSGPPQAGCHTNKSFFLKRLHGRERFHTECKHHTEENRAFLFLGSKSINSNFRTANTHISPSQPMVVAEAPSRPSPTATTSAPDKLSCLSLSSELSDKWDRNNKNNLPDNMWQKTSWTI